jgi:flagellar assembly factor FliW
VSTQNTEIIKNVNFGKIEVNESQKLFFPFGLFGFEDYKEYYLVDVNISPFLLLQEKSDENIGFIVCDPFLFFSDYEFDLDENTMKVIDAKSQDDILILTIITLSDKMEEITTNLLGPLVINRKNHVGIQYIINSDKYTTKHKLFLNKK